MYEENEGQLKLGAEELWAMARRRRWWLLLPLFLCWALVWAGSWLLPTAYQSEAQIVVEQQKVPEYYVEPNVAAHLQERLQTMTQQVLSRTRLQATIDSFHLYPPAHGIGRFFQAADPVDQMRKDIKIELVEAPGHPADLTAFKIYYSGDTPQRAQQVNSHLATLFIDENLKAEEQSSESTTNFLASELSEARAKLDEQEAQVRAFKANHMDVLPSQMESNVQILSSLQTELENNHRELDNANQQKLYLESQLQQLESAKAVLGSGDNGASSPEALEQELLELRHRLADLSAKYTDEHPEIIALKSKIAETEKLKKQVESEVATEQNQTTATKPDNSALINGSKGSSSTVIMQLTSQLKANALQIQNFQRREKSLQSQIATYQERIRLTPQTEQELSEISRGYEESKTNYNSLLQKQDQSKLATSLAQRQQGAQFRVLDPPSLPDKPATPNHLMLSLAGLGIGAVLGTLLVAIVELTNRRVRHEKELADLVPARVLVCVPHLAIPGEARLEAASRKLELIAAVAMVALIVAGNFYSFYKG
jgi:polysaccharide biosynthesis transport protein